MRLFSLRLIMKLKQLHDKFTTYRFSECVEHSCHVRWRNEHSSSWCFSLNRLEGKISSKAQKQTTINVFILKEGAIDVNEKTCLRIAVYWMKVIFISLVLVNTYLFIWVCVLIGTDTVINSRDCERKEFHDKYKVTKNFYFKVTILKYVTC